MCYAYSRTNKTRQQSEGDCQAKWQFSIRDLFVHFTAVAMLISFWATIMSLVKHK
jgi:hypothetical protein